MSRAVALLLASPGDVSDLRKLGIQFARKVCGDRQTEERAVSHLDGSLFDIQLMKKLFQGKSIALHDIVYQTRFRKQDALQKIKDFFLEDSQSQVYIIYYSGHGEYGTGNWVFTDATVSCDEIITIWCQLRNCERCHLWIISDSCFAGQWIERTRKSIRKNCMHIHVLCSSAANKVSFDTPNGGDFTVNFASANFRELRTPAVSCEFHCGIEQRVIHHPIIGNYFEKNWPMLNKFENENRTSSYEAFLPFTHANSQPELYFNDTISHKNMHQTKHSSGQHPVSVQKQREQHMQEVQKNRNHYMSDVQVQRQQYIQEAQQNRNQYMLNIQRQRKLK